MPPPIRRTKDTHKLPAPNKKRVLPKDPVNFTNWRGIEPPSDADMQLWMTAEAALILRYLEYWQRATQTANVREYKISCDSSLKDEWEKWVHQADVETGEIYDEVVRRDMEQRMAHIYKNTKKSYHTETGNEAHRMYQLAQGVLEGEVAPCQVV